MNFRSWICNTFWPLSNAHGTKKPSAKGQNHIHRPHVPTSSFQRISSEDYWALKSNQILNLTYHSYWKKNLKNNLMWNTHAKTFVIFWHDGIWWHTPGTILLSTEKQGPESMPSNHTYYISTKKKRWKFKIRLVSREFFDSYFESVTITFQRTRKVKVKHRTGKLSRDLKLIDSRREETRYDQRLIIFLLPRPTFYLIFSRVSFGMVRKIWKSLLHLWLRKEAAGKRLKNAAQAAYNLSQASKILQQ